MATTYPWASVLNSIRTAILGRDVRENIAQMGEYCKKYADEAGTRADSAKQAAAGSASAAAASATNASQSATAAAGSATAANQSAQQAAQTAADTAASTLSALGLTVVDGKICAVYRREST